MRIICLFLICISIGWAGNQTTRKFITNSTGNVELEDLTPIQNPITPYAATNLKLFRIYDEYGRFLTLSVKLDELENYLPPIYFGPAAVKTFSPLSTSMFAFRFSIPLEKESNIPR